MKIRWFPTVTVLSLLGAFPATSSAQSLEAEQAQSSVRQQQYSSRFGKTQVEAQYSADGTRTFELKSSSHSAPRYWTEAATTTQLYSDNTLLDALYSMALLEKTENSVQEITDWGFNDQQPLPCPCFETGEKWNYVWTRDLSYSIDLTLGYQDPSRAIESLLFKTSAVRPELVARGVSPTTVALQDTGSGGSWPVSSDRVVWILAASTVSPSAQQDITTAAAQRAWLEQWYPIAKNTLLQDRAMVFSPGMGLYRGETSFLDWREQSYPAWTAQDTVFLADSFALSTNVLHYVALQKTAAAAKQLEPAMAAQFEQWAAQLKTAINQAFWLPDAGMYASYVGPEHHPIAVRQFDLLGLALAIQHQVASPSQAQQILANYPLTPAGPPVFFPALPEIPIYHNRAIWPFVTAYAARAAKTQQHSALFQPLLLSSFQASALQLSNMENFEWLTQAIHVEDGALSGPVVNSKRQLWSVAGFLDLITGSLLGLEVSANQLTVNPYLPVKLVRDLRLGQRLEMRQFKLGDRSLTVTWALPEAGHKVTGQQATGSLSAGHNDHRQAQQSYRLEQVILNGVSAELTGPHQWQIGVDDLTLAENTLELTLVAVDEPVQQVTLKKVQDPKKLSTTEQQQLFAPKAPTLALQTQDQGRIALTFDAQGEADTRFILAKNGQSLPATTKTQFRTQVSTQGASCFSLSQMRKSTGLTSLPSPILCTDFARQTFLAGQGLLSDDHAVSTHLSKPVFKNWGQPEQQLTLQITAPSTAKYRLQLEYFIDNGPINTGITAVVKQAVVQCGSSAVQTLPLVMPHLATATQSGLSSHGYFQAKQGDNCQIRILDGFNMSYLQHFSLYTGGKGGRSGPLNHAVIHAAHIQPLAE